MLSEAMIYSGDNSLQFLTPLIEQVVKSANMALHDIEIISVVVGPGSWTGLRIGVETAKTLSHVLNIPIIGVYSLDVLSANLRYSNFPVWCALDARKGNVIVGQFDCSKMKPVSAGEFQLVSIKKFLEMIKSPSLIIGSANDLLKKSPWWNQQFHSTTPDFLNVISARNVCLLGLEKLLRNGADNTLQLVPFYFQKSEAETQWGIHF